MSFAPHHLRIWHKLPLAGISIAGLAFGMSSQTLAAEKFVVVDSALNTRVFTIVGLDSNYDLNSDLAETASLIPDIGKIADSSIASYQLKDDVSSPYTLSFATLQYNYRQASSGLWYLTKSILPLAAKNYESFFTDAGIASYSANLRLDALKSYQQQNSLTLNSQRESLLQNFLRRALSDGNALGSTPYINAYKDVLTTIYKARKELAAGAKGVPLSQQEQDELAKSFNFSIANQELLKRLGVTQPTSANSTSTSPEQVSANLSRLGLSPDFIKRYLQAYPEAELVSTAYLASRKEAPTAEQIPTNAEIKNTLRFVHRSKILADMLGQQYDNLLDKVNLEQSGSEKAKDLLFRQITETKQLQNDFLLAKNAYIDAINLVLGEEFGTFDVVQGFSGTSVDELKKSLVNWRDYFSILTPNPKEYKANTKLFFSYRDKNSTQEQSYDQNRLYLERKWVLKQLEGNLKLLVGRTSFTPGNTRFSINTITNQRPDFAQAQTQAEQNPTNYWALLNGNLHRQLVRFDTFQSLAPIGFTSYKEPFHSDAWINIARARDTLLLYKGVNAESYRLSIPPQSAELTRIDDFLNSPTQQILPHLRQLRSQVWSIGNYRWNALAAIKVPSLTLSHNQVSATGEVSSNQYPKVEIKARNYERHPYQDDLLAIAEIGHTGNTTTVLRDLDLVAAQGFYGTFGISYTPELETADKQMSLEEFDWSGIHSGKVRPYAYNQDKNPSLTYLLLRGIGRKNPNQFVFDARNQNSLTNHPALSKYVTFVTSISNKDLNQTCKDVLSNCLLVADDFDPVSRYLEAASLVLQQYSFFTPEQVRYTLQSTATPVGADPTAEGYNPTQAKNLGLLNVSEALLGPRWLPSKAYLNYASAPSRELRQRTIAFHNPIKADYLIGSAADEQTIVFTGQNLYLDTYIQDGGQLVITAPENTIGVSSTVRDTRIPADFNPRLQRISYRNPSSTTDTNVRGSDSDPQATPGTVNNTAAVPTSQAEKFAEFLGAGSNQAAMNSVEVRGTRVVVRDALLGSLSTSSSFTTLESAVTLNFSDDPSKATTQPEVYSDAGWQKYSYAYLKGKYVRRSNSLVNLENVHFFSDYLPDAHTTTVYQVDSQGKQTVYFDQAQDKFLGYAVINFADGLKSNLTKARLWAQVATKPTIAQPQSQFKGIWLYGSAKHLYTVGQKVKFAYTEDFTGVNPTEVTADKDEFAGLDNKTGRRHLEYAYVDLTPRQARDVSRSVATNLAQDADASSLNAHALLAALSLDASNQTANRAAKMATQITNLTTLLTQEDLKAQDLTEAEAENKETHTTELAGSNATTGANPELASADNPARAVAADTDTGTNADIELAHNQDSQDSNQDKLLTQDATADKHLSLEEAESKLLSQKEAEAQTKQAQLLALAEEVPNLTLAQKQALFTRARENASLLYADALETSADKTTDKGTDSTTKTSANPELAALTSAPLTANLLTAAANLQTSLAQANDQEIAQVLYRTSGSLYANSQVATSGIHKQQSVGFFQELPFAASPYALEFVQAPAQYGTKSLAHFKSQASPSAQANPESQANSESQVNSTDSPKFSNSQLASASSTTTYARYDYQQAKWTQEKSGLVGQASQHSASMGIFTTKSLLEAANGASSFRSVSSLSQSLGLDSFVGGVALSTTTGTWTEDYAANAANSVTAASADVASTRVSEVNFKQVGMQAAFGLASNKLALALTSAFAYQGAQVNRTIAKAADLQAETTAYQGLLGLQVQAKLGTSLRGVKFTGGLAYVLRHTNAFSEKVSSEAAQDPTNLAQLFALQAQASTKGAPLANLGLHAYWSFGNSGLARQLQLKAAVSYDFSQADAYTLQVSTKPSQLNASTASANTASAPTFGTGSSFAPGWQGQVKLGYRHDLTPTWTLSAEAGMSLTSYWLAKQASFTLSYRF